MSQNIMNKKEVAESIDEWLVKKNPLIKVGQALGKVIEKW